MLECKKCSVELTEDNTYKRSGRDTEFPVGYYRFCKTCYNNNRVANIRDNKLKQVEYMGGRCQKCGYDKCMDALEFHHLDPAVKEEQPSRLKQVTDEARWKKELDKCILLCSNCHRETHSELRGVS